MKNKKIIAFIFLIALLAFPLLSSKKTTDLKSKAIELIRSSIVADTHEDTPTTIYEGKSITIRREDGQIDFPRMLEGGLNSPVFAIWIPNKLDNKNPEVYALKVMAATLREIYKNEKLVEIAYSSDDIQRIVKSGKIAITFSLENSSVFHSVEYVDIFYKLGIRMASLTHMSSNYLSDSSTGKEKWSGLSPLGKEIIRRMNKVGMIVDVSHLSDKAVEDILSISTAPIIASHSCARALAEHPRNLSDKLIMTIAAKGGLIDVNFASFYLDGNLLKRYKEISKKYKKLKAQIEKKYPNKGEKYKKEIEELKRAQKKEYYSVKPDLKIVVRHIKYIKELVGIDHVGIGSDFEGIGNSAPKGLEDVTHLPDLVVEMIKAGFTDSEIKKVLGLNFIRLYKEVEKRKTINL